MKKSSKILIALSGLVIAFGTAYALSVNPRANEITDYKPGHTHNEGITQGAVQHSGGTDAYGCHNASVPYHCH